LTTCKIPPDTSLSEACQNFHAEASPIGKGSASGHMKRNFPLFAHVDLAKFPTPGKMIKLIA
jgi:hypothetical protein